MIWHKLCIVPILLEVLERLAISYNKATCFVYKQFCFCYCPWKDLSLPQGYGWVNLSSLELLSLIFRGQEQWAQCDSCSKCRRLPVDVLLPPKWTCADNNWDQSRSAFRQSYFLCILTLTKFQRKSFHFLRYFVVRSSCSAPDELTPRELENLLRLNKGTFSVFNYARFLPNLCSSWVWLPTNKYYIIKSRVYTVKLD